MEKELSMEDEEGNQRSRRDTRKAWCPYSLERVSLLLTTVIYPWEMISSHTHTSFMLGVRHRESMSPEKSPGGRRTTEGSGKLH